MPVDLACWADKSDINRRKPMTPRITRRQAEAVFADVVTRYAAHLEGVAKNSPDYPQLKKDWQPNWDNDGAPIPWAIVWPGGPDDWARLYACGGFNEEAAVLAAEFVGRERTLQMAREGKFTEQPGPAHEGISIDCGTSFIL